MLRTLIRLFVPESLRLAWWRRKEVRRKLRAIAVHRRKVVPIPHGLPGELIVSLTSYGPRLRNLHLTLESLANQCVRPDRIILWMAESDLPALPRTVTRLARQHIIEIRSCPDVRSYKKLVFALEQFPDAFIATADDDMFYKPDWLERLIADWQPGVITCWRAHRVPRNGATVPSYLTWEWDVQDAEATKPSDDIMPTGVGGIFYPPHSLHPDTRHRSEYMTLCPDADDLWFYWQARRMGTLYRKVGGPFERICWPESQNITLFNHNAKENDRRIAQMVKRYGLPLAPTAEAGPESSNIRDERIPISRS